MKSSKQIVMFAEEEIPDPVRPFIKWVGGKGRLVADIHAIMPVTFGDYYEPFLGGGAIFWSLVHRLQKAKHAAFLSDMNDEIMHVYKMVRNDVDGLVAELSRYEYAKEEYYDRRSAIVKDLTAVERAARTIYLNKTCFNGLYRVNKKGQFNVPFGKYTNPTICDEENLRACSAALQGEVTIWSKDYEEVAKKAKEGDLVYFDPPYIPASATSNFTAYTASGFTAEDQAALGDLFKGLVARGVMCILSNSDTPLTREIYEGCRMVRANIGRTINSKAEARGKVGELLILGGF